MSSDVEYDRSCCRCFCFFFQAEDGIRDLVRSRGLGDVYKRQVPSAQARTNVTTDSEPSMNASRAADTLSGRAATLSLIHI